MAVSLTVARAVVRAGQLLAYREGLGRLKQAAEARGARFWVFRSTATPDTFLEFVETPDASAGSRTRAEIAADAALREVALYAPDAETVWTEFQL